MARIAVGRATFFVAGAGLVLAQAVAGCGSTDAPSQGKGGNSGESGSPDEGGRVSDSGGSGGSGEGAGSGESGSPGESGGANSASGGVGGGGRPNATGGKGNTGGKGGIAGGGAGGGPIAGSAGVGNFAGGITFGGGGAGGFLGGGTGGKASGTGGKVSGTGGKASGTGGAPGCVEGKPCKCETLVGTSKCTGSVESCSCPPAAECESKADSACFVPCGGEPFGAWVLTDACFASTSASSGTTCQQVLDGTPGDNDLRLRILDGGDMQLLGHEAWSLRARVSPACLSISTVNSCAFASYWPDSLLFSTVGSSICKANACGVCDCDGDAYGEVSGFFGFDRWSRSGTNLTLGRTTTPYCVTGDQLWIGGSDSNGTPKVSYKFKKQSCTGTPLACAARTAEQCAGPSCQVGLCKATTGVLARCATAYFEADCSVLQGCTWDPNGCAGTASETCEFENCGDEAGCTWGAPQQRCGGYPFSCEERPVANCAGDGCAVRQCRANFSDYGDCQALNATECAQAPGCILTSGVCTGQALCTAQTSAAVCGKLSNCFAEPFCGGTPTACAGLSVAACQGVLGCRLEW